MKNVMETKDPVTNDVNHDLSIINHDNNDKHWNKTV